MSFWYSLSLAKKDYLGSKNTEKVLYGLQAFFFLKTKLLKVKDKVSQQALLSTITITVVNDSLNTIQLTTDKNGDALHIIQLGEYLLNVDKPAYLFYSDKIDIKEEGQVDIGAELFWWFSNFSKDFGNHWKTGSS